MKARASSSSTGVVAKHTNPLGGNSNTTPKATVGVAPVEGNSMTECPPKDDWLTLQQKMVHINYGSELNNGETECEITPMSPTSPHEDDAVSNGCVHMSRMHAERIVDSVAFSGMIITAIVANSIIVGVYANQQISDETFDHADEGFLLLFILEMIAKLWGYGVSKYFSCLWNIFDFTVVMIGIGSTLIHIVPVSATVARVLRMIRVVRVFRGVSASKQLMLLLFALAESAVAIMWVILLTILILYVFGCICTISIGRDPTVMAALPAESHAYFGSVQRSMLSLLQIMTFDSWVSGITRTFASEFPATGFFLVFFMVIAGLGIMNLLAAIFVDKLMKLTDEDLRLKKEKAEKERRQVCEKLQAVFAAFDEDGDGTLSVKELIAGVSGMDANGNGSIEMTEVHQHFQSVGLSVEDAAHVISTMAAQNKFNEDDDTKGVNYDQFIDCIFAFHEPATKKDIFDVHADVTRLLTVLESSGARCADATPTAGAAASQRPPLDSRSGDSQLVRVAADVAALSSRINDLECKLERSTAALDAKMSQILAAVQLRPQAAAVAV